MSSHGEMLRGGGGLLETEMRGDMHNFIDHEVDLTPFAKYYLYDAEWCKRSMHEIASGMDLSLEMEYLSTRHEMMPNILEVQDESMQQISTREMACGSDVVCEIDQVTSQRAPLSIEENQHVPNESCESQEPLNVSNRSEMRSDCSFNSPFINQMCSTQLRCRLIEETKRSFANSHRKSMEKRCRESRIDQNRYSRVVSFDRADNWKADHDFLRAKFLTCVGLEPPQVLRVIDIEATCSQQERVVLIDYLTGGVQQVGYTAISHTYGMDVYEVFDCVCTTECYAKVRRCSDKPCPHEHQDPSSVRAGSEKRNRVVNDILGMCAILKAAGVSYAWHDGVCIAQHNESEVEETIKHIGWIYATAKDTVIFLHYVGNPMAPIKHGIVRDELTCRWHTRVWTLQEAALSKCRRYCVRVGSSPLSDCRSLEEFEEKIALLYADHSSRIEIIEEEPFFEILKEMERVLRFLCRNTAANLAMPDDDDVIVESNWMWIKAMSWYSCIIQFLNTLLWTCFEFPTIDRALIMCSSRDSKHVGDRMNSILALAEVKNFVAPKKENVEASTMEFFKRQGQRGLAMALFSTNDWFHYKDKQYMNEVRRHTWPPILWRKVIFYPADDDFHNRIGFEVLEDGRMELRGELVCVEVIFTAKLKEVQLYEKDPTEYALHTQSLAVLDLLEASQDLAYLAMDLTFFDFETRFRAKLSGIPAPCRNMGTVYISAFERCSSQGPVVYGQEIEEAESFHAHLVLPRHTLSDSDGLGMPFLLVQGTLHAQVYKIGLFKPTNFFLDCLKTILDRPAITTIEKLVII